MAAFPSSKDNYFRLPKLEDDSAIKKANRDLAERLRALDFNSVAPGSNSAMATRSCFSVAPSSTPRLCL